MTRIKLAVWGLTGPDAGRHRVQATGYAIQQEGETPADAVVRSIARRTGLARVTGPLPEYEVQERGKVVEVHYSAILGRRCGDGGTPVTGVWFSVPVGAL